MRPAFSKPLASAGIAILFAFASANSAFAEGTQSETTQSVGTQIAAAGVADDRLPEKNLNSVPLDGLGYDVGISSSPVVRQLTAARPNEDLVICIAGCFGVRDRVVYAQPIDPQARVKANATASVGASDGTGGSIGHGMRGSQ